MGEFTEKQLQELETVFNLTRVETLPIKDGRIAKHQKVWWKCEEGPQHVFAESHWENILKYPEIYSLGEPRYTVTYLD